MKITKYEDLGLEVTLEKKIYNSSMYEHEKKETISIKGKYGWLIWA